MQIAANSSSLRSWVPVAPDSDFPIQNLPFGIFATPGVAPRVGVAIGEHVLDMQQLADAGLLDGCGVARSVFAQPSLNAFAATGRSVQRNVRNRVSELLRDDNAELRDNTTLVASALYQQADVQMLLPVEIGDYTDFYSSIEHATNVGIMFRGKDNALMPNWKHIPVGYHGRSSSIVVSGTDVHRPKGQMQLVEGEAPIFGPSRQMDFELEVAFIVGQGNAMGDPIPADAVEDHLFGMVLFNDWSARDIQKWEYVPLGPFLGKNFGSSVSPWVVLMDALEPLRVAGPVQDPQPLPYLQTAGPANFDIGLEVLIQPEGAAETTVSRSNFKYMYWSMRQQLAHHTINGCNMRTGDMCASGTISGPTEGSYGSMLELAWKGTKPLPMPDGTERKFLQDGDTVIIRGASITSEGVRIGFGEVKGKVLPAK
jgi:fumarylacetoacetase